MALRIFFRRVVVSGRLSVPPSGPLILAANHPNSLVDALAMGWVSHRPVHFLARSGLFRNPVANRFFRACGAIPVYRGQDAPADAGHTARNAESFREAHDLLAGGGVIGIFPEGVSHEELAVKQLKTGIARIALSVEQEQGWSLGVRIAPLGLNFTDRATFRSDLFIRVGEPIDVREWREEYQTDPKDCARALVAELAGRIEALVVTVPDSGSAGLLGDIEGIFGDELGGAEPRGASVRASSRHRHAFRTRLASAIEHFQRGDPGAATTVRAEMQNYLGELRDRGLSDTVIRRAGEATNLTGAISARLGAVLVALPFAAFGMAVNGLPYFMIGAVGRRFRSTDGATMVSTAKLVAGVVLFPPVYAILGWLAFRAVGPLAAALACAGAFLCGGIALGLGSAIGALGRDFAALRLRLFSRDLNSRLQQQRLALLRTLERLRDDYLSREGGG